MSERLRVTARLDRFVGERGTYHLVTIGGNPAQTISLHEKLARLEFGRRRGFGSVKVVAQIGATAWKTSVFPSSEGEWWLLVGKRVMAAESLDAGRTLSVELALL